VSALLIGFGPSELLLIAFIVLILFGANRIPQLMTGIGKGIRGLKRGLNEDENIVVTPDERRVDPSSSGGEAPDLNESAKVGPAQEQVEDAELLEK